MSSRMSTVNLTHHFLIAMPSMADPYFAKTLTYICEHNDQGALGLVVNRPIDMTLQALFERLSLTLRDGGRKRRADLLRRPGADRPRLRAARAGGQLAVDAARARRHRPHHVEGHPRGGGARRGPGAHAGHARLRRLVARAARARAVAERLAHGGSARRHHLRDARPKSACRRRWNSSASISRGCRTKRDMPERRAAPSSPSISVSSVSASPSASLNCAPRIRCRPVSGLCSQIQKLVAEWKPASAGRGPADIRARRAAQDDAPGRGFRPAPGAALQAAGGARR